MKKVLITGGSGFIGFHLAKKCVKLNLEVTSISRNNPPKRRRLKKVQYIKCDLTKKSEVKNKLKKQYDYIFNLSGTVNHNNKKKTFLSHYQVVENLTKRYQNSPPKMFVQLSSSAEYGGISKPPEETLNCKPKSFYGRAKFKSTKYLINLFKKNSFPVVIFRLYQAYGPYQDTNRLIPIVINSCKKNLSFNCSDGNQYRDFVYIDDVVDVFIKCLKNKNIFGQIYNLGTGKPIKIKKIIEFISQYYKGGNPLYGKIKLRKDESKLIYANILKIKKDFNWKPKNTFKKGLNKTLKFYGKKK